MHGIVEFFSTALGISGTWLTTCRSQKSAKIFGLTHRWNVPDLIETFLVLQAQQLYYRNLFAMI